MGSNSELQQMVIEALQAAYPHLTTDQLAALCYASGISPWIAFPWHKDDPLMKEKKDVT